MGTVTPFWLRWLSLTSSSPAVLHLREAARLHTGVGFAGRNGCGAFCLHIRQVLLDALHQLGGAFARLDAVRQRGGDLVTRRFVDAAYPFQAWRR